MASKPKPEGEPETKALVLADVASDARMWADTIEGLDDPIVREAALVEAAKATLTGKEKIDRFVHFLKRAEFEGEWSKAEAARHTARRKAFENIVESMKRYAKGAMKENELPRLEGVERTIWLQPTGKSAVVINDEVAVPAHCKYISVKMRLSDWQEVVASLWPELTELERASALSSLIKSQDTEVSKTLVLEAFERGEDVPGADLELDNTSLRTK